MLNPPELIIFPVVYIYCGIVCVVLPCFLLFTNFSMMVESYDTNTLMNGIAKVYTFVIQGLSAGCILCAIIMRGLSLNEY